MENKYVFDSSGMLEGTKEWFDIILPENFTTDYEEIFDGKYYIPSNEQLEFYKSHKDYDLYHLFYMIEYSEEELLQEKQLKNKEVESKRETEYKNSADPLYMGYVKNMALGNDEKATEYYNKWLEAIQTIKEENPYIE